MIIIILIILGLCFGSFVNALVFRLHIQSKKQSLNGSLESVKKKLKKQITENRLQKTQNRYSILTGRSMCVNCKHELKAMDLIPIFSWFMLAGKCRYCKKPISWQYPSVEIFTAVVFVLSYIFWPTDFNSIEYTIFGLWLACLLGLTALIVYDIRWMILPNRIVLPLYFLGLGIIILRLIQNPEALTLYQNLTAILIGGGLFYLIFQLSKGKWIGGGDVKLGFLLGALVGRADYAFLMLFLASLLGCLYILPALASKKLKRSSRVPFGPFLIIATIIVVLFGNDIIIWYFDQILTTT